MDTINFIGEWIDRLNPLLSTIFAFLSWAVGFFQHHLFIRIKQNRFDRLLNLKPDVDCEVIVPIRYGKLQQKFAGQQEFTLAVAYNYVTVEECMTISELSNLLSHKKIHIIHDLDYMKTENNKFCFGSILSNDYTVHFFRSLTGVYLKGRFFRGSKESLRHEGMKHLSDLMTDRKEKHAVYFASLENSEDILEYTYDPSGDYLIWVKVCSKDYQQKNHGTVHFIFGDKARTATHAIQFISSHCDEFHKILKKNNHLDHHFLVMRYSATHEFDLSSLVDLTEKML